MDYINIPNTDLKISRLGLGLMRISKKRVEEVEDLILTALENGINFFDHADIYGGGVCETLFGEVLKRHPNIRSKMVIQTKCGIRKGFYDSSKEHIISSVEGSLNRLGIDMIDILLIHRPDTLMEIDEIAEAFNELKASKKVRYFGVSNMNPSQIELLKKRVQVPLLFNQLQFSIVHSGMVDVGFNVNMKNQMATDLDGGILEYSRLHDMTIQAWSILQASWEEGTFLNHSKYTKLNETLNNLATKYSVTPSAVALAWILTHPAKMQGIAGTTSPVHLTELCAATDIQLTKKEWYDLYLSVGKILP